MGCGKGIRLYTAEYLKIPRRVGHLELHLILIPGPGRHEYVLVMPCCRVVTLLDVPKNTLDRWCVARCRNCPRPKPHKLLVSCVFLILLTIAPP